MSITISVPDALRKTVEMRSGGRNTILYDVNGDYPSEMVLVEKFTNDYVFGNGDSNSFSAFISHGETRDIVYYSKYQNVVYGSIGTSASRACSRAGKVPQTGINYNQAKLACRNRGPGWHEMSYIEWAAIMLITNKNGVQPKGNNDYGKDYQDSDTFVNRGHKIGENKVAAGSGPKSWSHDGTDNGIFDLNGNVWEWLGGMKLVDGQIYINDQNLNNDFNTAEADWHATNLFFDSVNRDFNDTLPEHFTVGGNTLLAEGTHDDEILLLQKMGFLSRGTENELAGYNYRTITDERMLIRGGSWGNGAGAGLGSLNLNTLCLSSSSSVGFRSVFC